MEERTIYKAYRFRIYPDAEQRRQFEINFDCCRYVYNHFLALRSFTFAQKRGIQDLDELMAGGFPKRRLTAIVKAESDHFAFIQDQSCSSLCEDMRLLRDYVPEVHAAYWHWALANGHAERDVEVPGRFTMSKMLTQLKKQARDEDGELFLRRADAHALGFELINLEKAFKGFFERCKRGGNPGYPKYKRRGSDRQSFKTSGARVELDYERGYMKLPKAGWVKAVLHREIEGGESRLSA